MSVAIEDKDIRVADSTASKIEFKYIYTPFRKPCAWECWLPWDYWQIETTDIGFGTGELESEDDD
jgi:hypothetical protein